MTPQQDGRNDPLRAAIGELADLIVRPAAVRPLRAQQEMYAALRAAALAAAEAEAADARGLQPHHEQGGETQGKKEGEEAQGKKEKKEGDEGRRRAYAAWLRGGVVGAHHRAMGDERLALMYLTTGGLGGLGWALDVALIPLYEARRRPPLCLRFLRAAQSFAYAWIVGWVTLAVALLLVHEAGLPLLLGLEAARVGALLALWVAGELGSKTCLGMIALLRPAPSFSTNPTFDEAYGTLYSTIGTVFALSAVWRFVTFPLVGAQWGFGYNFPAADERDTTKMPARINALAARAEHAATRFYLAFFCLCIGWHLVQLPPRRPPF